MKCIKCHKKIGWLEPKLKDENMKSYCNECAEKEKAKSLKDWVVGQDNPINTPISKKDSKSSFDPIRNNAYRILGLDVTVGQKDVLKRYKEVINRLKIDDFPAYDLDIGLPNKFRNEESINDALKRLQNPKNNLKEYFFWFSISDTIDEKSLKYLQNDDINKAIQTWKNASENNNSTAYFYKKNLAVLYCLLLFKQGNDTYLKQSIDLWNEIINSDKFWIAFTKKYRINNAQTVSVEIISEFRKTAIKNISDVYTDLYQHYKDSKYIKTFQEKFITHGEKTEKNVLKPIYQLVYDSIEKLNKINLLEDEEIEEREDKCHNCGDINSEGYWDYDDGSVLCEKCHKQIGKKWQKKVDESEENGQDQNKKIKQIQKEIILLESHLDELNKAGLHEASQSKVVRDHAAKSIRDISVRVHNELYLPEESITLLKTAIKICGTKNMKEKYEDELKLIKKIANNDQKNAVVLEIPRFWSKGEQITFRNNFVEYGERKMYYKDITKISYHGVRNTSYGVETSKNYSFSIISEKDDISLSFSGEEDLWYRLIDISKQVIEPLIVAKLIKLIFEKGETVSIGNVDFDKRGYHRSKFFGGIESVHWEDTLYIPQISQGNMILYKKEDGVGKHFASISMENYNAVVLKELLTACAEEYAMRH